MSADAPVDLEDAPDEEIPAPLADVDPPTTFPRAFAVRFASLKRWDVASFHDIHWHWPDESLQQIGSFLKKRKQKVNRRNTPFRDLQPVTIHFDGSMDKRRVEGAREYTMELWSAMPGDIVVAKIDLKNGAVGIVPEGWDNVVVTGHFAVYEPDLTQVLPAYFHRVIQCPTFKAHLWRNKVGAEGRKEVKLDFFEGQRIPLPSLPVQEAIVSYWNDAHDRVARAYEDYRQLTAALNAMLLAAAGGRAGLAPLKERAVVIDWKNVAQWDIKAARAAAFRVIHPTFEPLGRYVEDATVLVRPFDTPEHDWPVYGVNNRRGVVFSHYQKGCNFNAPYKRIEKDWFFHNPTRSSVGSLGIVPDVPEDALTSPEYQVWRIRENSKDKLLPGYVAVLISTPFFIELIQVHRVGAVKQRLYTENLMEMRVPVPPVEEQERIAMERISALEEIQSAQENLARVRTEVESMILGTLSVPVSDSAVSG